MHPKTRKILQLLRLRQVCSLMSVFTIALLILEFCLIVCKTEHLFILDLQWRVPQSQQGDY